MTYCVALHCVNGGDGDVAMLAGSDVEGEECEKEYVSPEDHCCALMWRRQ